MTRLSELPRIKLTEKDKSALIGISVQYETAQGMYEDKSGDTKELYARSYKASRVRAKATTALLMWANNRLTEGVVGVGFPKGANFPRLRKGFDASYDHRKWGSAGCAREAAKYLRNVIKRGWI